LAKRKRWIHEVTWETKRTQLDDKKESEVYLVRVRDTQAKQGHIAITWNEKGNSRVSQILEKQHAQGSNVTGRSNETPSMTSFPSVTYLE
jgi:hypothetical protein